MTPDIPIDEALQHSQLLGAALGDTSTWQTWLTVLRAAYGLPLNDAQRQIFAEVSGNRERPKQRVRELWNVVGRGGGKSKIAAAVAVHIALLQRHRLSAGETGHVLVLSQTMGQAKVVFDYALAFIESSPILQQEIESTTQSEIRLRNNVTICTHPASYRSVRGRSLLAVICDEISFWRDESSMLPDKEAYRAVLPSLIRTGGQLIGISTPYRKLGLLYEKFHDHFGVDDDDTLVVRGSSLQFNPTLSENDIAKALAADPEANIAEFEAQFRGDAASFLADDDIDAAVDYDRPSELPPRPGYTYHAFVDPSGGRNDHFTIAIGHVEKADDGSKRIVIDLLRGQLSPDPKTTVAEYCALLRTYGLREVTGDNYAAGWTEATFRDFSARYLRADLPKMCWAFCTICTSPHTALA